jgi:uncharacterized protein
MTPQERDLITQLLSRLPGAQEPKDPEAETLIRDAMARRSDAPYFLVQTVLVQEMALGEAQNRITELERQVAAAKTAPAAQPTSFLGRALRGSVPASGSGPWSTAPSAQPNQAWSQPSAAPAAAPQPAPMMPLAAGGSGFLRQAAMTAAGVAGGALLFQGIQSLFGPHYGNVLAGMPMQPGISETVTNNYYGDQAPGSPDLRQADYQQGDNPAQDDTLAQYADDTDPGQDFGSGDSGSFDV